MTAGESIYCGKCGYELTGLAIRGHCPECGHAYDRGYGQGVSRSAGGDRADFWVRHALTLGLLALTVVVILVAGLAAWGAGSWVPLMWGLVLAAVCGLATLASFVRDRGDG